MPTPPDSGKKEQSSTYFVQNRENEEELQRLTVQDRLITASMGGVLPEQPEPTSFQRVLDIGCGTGGWIIEVAQTYPSMSLVGIDISQHMIDYAREQALIHQVADRVKLAVMDALLILEFPAAFFDLVNLRFGISFMRTWDWPKMLSEMLRVTRPGGIVRVTDNNIVHQSTSPALKQLHEIGVCALYQAGHLFTREGSGLSAHLERLLVQHKCKQVQTKAYALEFQAGTAQGQAYYEDMAHVFNTTRPFIKKWGCLSSDYDAIYQQALAEMRQSTFHVTWNLLSAWGNKFE